MVDLQGYENDGEQPTDRSRSSAMSRAVSVLNTEVPLLGTAMLTNTWTDPFPDERPLRRRDQPHIPFQSKAMPGHFGMVYLKRTHVEGAVALCVLANCDRAEVCCVCVGSDVLGVDFLCFAETNWDRESVVSVEKFGTQAARRRRVCVRCAQIHMVG